MPSTTTLKVGLDVALPSDARACDACVGRLLDQLQGRAGIGDVHIDRSDPDQPRLCFHVDPSQVSFERVRAMVQPEKRPSWRTSAPR